MNPHLSQAELVEQLYGVGAREAHLEDCAECAARFHALLLKKARLRGGVEARSAVSGAFLAAQRRAIYARLDRAASSYVRWAPALAGAGLLAMGLLLLPHARVEAPPAQAPPAAPAALTTTADEQLFSDLYSMEQSVEPSAAAPINELFEEGAGAGQQ